MGHSSITVKSNIYTHIDGEMLKEAAVMIERPLPEERAKSNKMNGHDPEEKIAG